MPHKYTLEELKELRLLKNENYILMSSTNLTNGEMFEVSKDTTGKLAIELSDKKYKAVENKLINIQKKAFKIMGEPALYFFWIPKLDDFKEFMRIQDKYIIDGAYKDIIYFLYSENEKNFGKREIL